MKFNIVIKNPHTNSIIDFEDLTLKVTVDSESVVDTTDLSTDLTSSTILNENSIFKHEAVILTGALTLSIELQHGSNSSNVPVNLSVKKSKQLTITLSKNDFLSFTNTFTIFDQTNDFDLYLIPSDISISYPNFVAYRKPFSNYLYVFNAASNNKSIVYISENNTNSIVYSNSNIIVDSFEQVEITQEIDVYTKTLIFDKNIFYPNFNLYLTTPNINNELSITQLNNVELVADFSELVETDYIAGEKDYFGREYIIIWYLYNYAGELLLTEIKGFKVKNKNDIYDSVLNAFNFIAPYEGDFVIKSSLGVFTRNEEIVIESGTLEKNTWYLIIGSDDGNFTSLGASTNLAGETFFCNADASPIWGSAGVVKLFMFELCSKSIVGVASNWVEVKETLVCGEYTITNTSVYDITYSVETFQEDFTWLQTSLPETIRPNSTITVNFSDGIKKLVIRRYDADLGYTDYEKIIPVYCAIKTCELDLINKILCDCCCDSTCESVCEKYYNFNAFVLLLHAFKLLIEDKFNVLNGVELLSVNNDSAINLKDVYDRLSTYCNTDCNC